VSKRLVALLAALVALAVIAAGCGSGGGGTETTSSLSKAEFVKKGNAICAKGNEEFEEGFEEFAKEHHINKNKKPTKAQINEVAEEVLLPVARQEVQTIRDLGLPSEGEEEADKVLKAAEKGIEAGEANPSSLATETGGPFKEANKLAREFGLTKCGEEE
jgi:hypothetical protein